jgi:uncharacterized protein (TIGR02118 family)
MIKLVALLKRRDDLTLEQFLEHYERRHAPLFARSIPAEVADAIISYSQNHAVALGGRGKDQPYDCVTEFRFADLAGLRAWSDWYLGPDGKVLRDDEETFMDTAARVVIVTEERELPHR